MIKIKTIKVCGKVVDNCHIAIVDEKGNDLVKPKHDYAPAFLDTLGDGCGDYIQIDIDFETGKIINWNKQKKYVKKYIKTGGKIFENSNS